MVRSFPRTMLQNRWRVVVWPGRCIEKCFGRYPLLALGHCTHLYSSSSTPSSSKEVQVPLHQWSPNHLHHPVALHLQRQQVGFKDGSFFHPVSCQVQLCIHRFVFWICYIIQWDLWLDPWSSWVHLCCHGCLLQSLCLRLCLCTLWRQFVYQFPF